MVLSDGFKRASLNDHDNIVGESSLNELPIELFITIIQHFSDCQTNSLS